MNNKSKIKYISLKEAAKITGYTPDHIGYLIREGKIHGKQIYCNIAWLTTKEAIIHYKKRKDRGENKSGGLQAKIQKIKVRIVGELEVLKLFLRVSRYLLPIIIILILSLSVLLIYFFSAGSKGIGQEKNRTFQEERPLPPFTY